MEKLRKKCSISISISSARRFLKQHGYRWKRKRRWPGYQRDESFIEMMKNEVLELKKLEDQEQLDLYFLDESGFSLQSYVPYAWQKAGETKRIASRQGGNMTVLGIINRKSQGKFQLMDKPPKAQQIYEFLDKLAQETKKQTVIVMDKASIHTAELIKEAIPKWKLKNLYIQYLPAAAPELNLIEILWRVMKYQWIKPDAYASKNSLKEHIIDILEKIGQEYRINFE